VLRFFLRQVDLHEHARAGAGFVRAGIQLSDELDPINRVNPLKRRGGFSRLVGLKATDEMPDKRRGVSREARDLVEPLLDAVFAEIMLARGGGQADVVCRKCLGDGDEKDVGRSPARPLGRRIDAASNGREAGGDLGQRLRDESVT
jgi:hypothetical protein